MKSTNDEIWNRLAHARQEVTSGESRDVSAPFGFAARVVAQWQDLSRAERFQLWRVWSLRASLLAGLVMLGALLLLQQTPVQASSASASWQSAASSDLPTLAIPLP